MGLFTLGEWVIKIDGVYLYIADPVMLNVLITTGVEPDASRARALLPIRKV